MSLDDDDDLLDEEFLPETEVSAEQTDAEIEEDLLLKGLKKHGFEFGDGISGEEIAANIRRLAQRAQSMPDEMELAELREAKARYRESQETPARQDEKPAPRPSLGKPVDAEQYVTFDEKAGYYIPKDPRYPNIKAVEEMNSWRTATEKNKQRLFENPLDFLMEAGLKDQLEGIKKQAKEELAEELRRQAEQQRAKAEADQFWDEVGEELYEVDKNGHVKLDVVGQPLMTRKGLRFQQYHREAYENGITDSLKAARYAYKKADAWSKRQKPAEESAGNEQEDASEAELSPEDVAENQKQSFTTRARAADEGGKRRKGDRVINRDASVVSAARNEAPQNDSGDFMAMARANARSMGVDL